MSTHARQGFKLTPICKARLDDDPHGEVLVCLVFRLCVGTWAKVRKDLFIMKALLWEWVYIN